MLIFTAIFCIVAYVASLVLIVRDPEVADDAFMLGVVSAACFILVFTEACRG
jgi:hypothetical protein